MNSPDGEGRQFGPDTGSDTAPSQDVQVRMLVDAYKVVIGYYDKLPVPVRDAFENMVNLIQIQSKDLEHVNKARADIARIRRETADRLSQALKDIEEWKAKAERDRLTGLMNKDALADAGKRLFEKSRENNKPLTEMVIDLDYFKGINDLYGHAAGDQVLKKIGALIEEVLRPTDHVFRDGDTPAEELALARDGGEEFVVILPVGLDGAKAAAERLRKRIEATKFSFSRVEDPLGPEEEVMVTASIGICQANHTQHSAHGEVKKVADAAAYSAKRDGRNCTYAFQNGSFVMVSPADRTIPEKRGSR